jgi:hypothetical protein
MRDLDALLNSLVNIDRHRLIAILASEADVAKRLAASTGQRSLSQRARRREAIERAARIERILAFIQHGEVGPELTVHDLLICKSLEDRFKRL